MNVKQNKNAVYVLPRVDLYLHALTTLCSSELGRNVSINIVTIHNLDLTINLNPKTVI